MPKNIIIKLFRFFRRLTKLDYLIIIFLLLSTVILFKFLNPQEKWITANIAVENASIFQADSLHKGDFELDTSGKRIAEITGLEIYDTISEPKQVTTNKNLFLRTKLLVGINSQGDFVYKNKTIKVGVPIQMLFNSIYVTGTISDLEGVNQRINTENKVLILKMYNQWPWFADSLKVGDSFIDQNGVKFLELLEKDVRPAEITVTTSSGETLLRTDPRKVDIILKVRAQVQSSQNGLTFQKYTGLQIGRDISFNIGQSRINYALIIGIE